MSTTYYGLREPITDIVISEVGDFRLVAIEVYGTRTGTLVLRREHLGAFLGCFEGQPEARAWAGGKDKGVEVQWFGPQGMTGRPASLVKVIGDGELFTMDAVLAQCGKGRKE